MFTKKEMKVFISWSGETSKKIGAFVNEWLPLVIQSSIPWFSPERIEDGEAWFSAIEEQLNETNFGVVCLTPDNFNSPWLNYEAGSLRKGLSKARVTILLFSLGTNDFKSPLGSLNMTKLDKEGICKWVHTLNSYTDRPVSDKIIDKQFDLCWPDFEAFLAELTVISEPKVPSRSNEDYLDEILSRIKGLEKTAPTQQIILNNIGPSSLSTISIEPFPSIDKKPISIEQLQYELRETIQQKGLIITGGNNAETGTVRYHLYFYDGGGIEASKLHTLAQALTKLGFQIISVTPGKI
jgi:uncharacterized protein YcfL